MKVDGLTAQNALGAEEPYKLGHPAVRLLLLAGIMIRDGFRHCSADCAAFRSADHLRCLQSGANQRPDTQCGMAADGVRKDARDAVHPGQDDVGGHLTNDVGIVFDAGSTGIGGPSVSLGGGAWCEVAGNERVQAVGRVVGHLGEPDAPGSGAAVLDLDGADDQHFALMAAPAAGQWIVLAAAGDLGFVDLDPAGERDPAGRHHAAAQLGTEQPRGLVGAEVELALQLQSRDAPGLRRGRLLE